MKRIRVCIPSFNQVRSLPACLDSVLAQAYDGWELVVADDGSTDGAAQVVSGYAGMTTSLRSMQRSRPIGYAKSVNEMLEDAQTDYVTVLSPHDRYLDPQFLRRSVEALDAQPRLNLIYGAFGDVDFEGHVTKANREFDRVLKMEGKELQHSILRFRIPLLSTVVVRRAVIDHAGYLDEDLQRASEIRWMFRLAENGDVQFDPRTVVGHPAQGLPGSTKLVARDLLNHRKDVLRVTRSSAASSRELSLAWESSRRRLMEEPEVPVEPAATVELFSAMPDLPDWLGEDVTEPTAALPQAPEAETPGAQRPAPAPKPTELRQPAPQSGAAPHRAPIPVEPTALDRPRAALPSHYSVGDLYDHRRIVVFGPPSVAKDFLAANDLGGDVLALANAAHGAHGSKVGEVPVLHPKVAMSQPVDTVLLLSPDHHERIEAWLAKNRPSVEVFRCWPGAKRR